MPLDPAPVALVTGASRGIGRGAAQRLARRGVRIAVHYHRNEGAARETLAALPGEGHALFAADVARTSDCADLIGAVVEQMGRVDLLVNNAGVFEDHDVRSEDAAAWLEVLERTLATNLTGAAVLSYHAVQRMRRYEPRREPFTAFGRGRIVNVSSRAAFRGELLAPGYAASKAGLNLFGQSLSRTLAPESIYVFCLAPGWVDTEMAQPTLSGPEAASVLAQHPLGRVARVDEVAAAIEWLALDAPAAMTGAVVDINGASYLRT
jgi:NAD(P)-dependent dehydrogenase (short-subunit alcohol dehydrogenase family)